MLSAKESSEMLERMSIEEKIKALESGIEQKTKNAIEKEIKATIAKYQRHVEITLQMGTKNEEMIVKDLLDVLGYKEVSVNAYGEGKEYINTTIKFSIPQ